MTKRNPSLPERMAVARANKAKPKGWRAAQREAFLLHLAQNCNVRRACAEVGMSPNSAYTLRKRDPAFRAGWRAAIAESYARHEMLQLERMLLGEEKVREAIADSTAREALELLSRFNPKVTDPRPRHRALALDEDLPDDDPDGEAALASIEAKLVKLRAYLAREAEGEAARDPDGEA